MKGVASFLNHTAACSQEVTSFQERFTQGSRSLHVRRLDLRFNARFVLGFNDRIPQLRAVASLFMKREHLSKYNPR